MRALSITLFAALLAGALTACGGGAFVAGGRNLPIPEAPGIYALTADGALYRLDGPPEWERETWADRSEFGPAVEFVVLEPQLAKAPATPDVPARLWRLAWHRSDIEPTGVAAPRTGSEWVVADLDSQAEPLTATWNPDVPGMVHLAPAGPLVPGLYEFALTRGTGLRARVGVRWSAVNKRDYAAANCVDRIGEDPPRFQPCATAPSPSSQGLVREVPAPATVAAPAIAEPLRIRLASPARENGRFRIHGAVVNSTAEAQPVPLMRGIIFDQAGRPADSWYFAAQDAVVGPRSEVPFTAWRLAGEGGSRLDVEFVER
jgi:hypothetical protein